MMTNSKYEYVKTFEQSSTLLPDTYMIVRVDGRGFHKFVPEPAPSLSTQLMFLDFQQSTNLRNLMTIMHWS